MASTALDCVSWEDERGTVCEKLWCGVVLEP